MGHDPAHSYHHAIYTADPETFKLTYVADVGGDMHVDMLGGSTTYDCDSKQVYVAIAYNNSTPRPAIKMVAVSLTTGAIVKMDPGLMLAGMAYDSQSKRVYGTRVASAETGEAVSPWVGAALSRGPTGVRARSTLRAGATYHRFLAYFDATNLSAPVVTVKQYNLTGAVGDLHTLDRTNRVHYSLLLGNPPPEKPWTQTDYCSKHGHACPTGSSCCRDPKATTDYGICYAVPTCSKMPPSGNPLNVSNFIYGVSIDTGKEVTKVPVCSIIPSAATVDAQCPWSIESALA
jgi:hypothetical protein